MPTPPKLLRHKPLDIDIYLCKKCGGDKMTLEQARKKFL